MSLHSNVENKLRHDFSGKRLLIKTKKNYILKLLLSEYCKKFLNILTKVNSIPAGYNYLDISIKKGLEETLNPFTFNYNPLDISF